MSNNNITPIGGHKNGEQSQPVPVAPGDLSFVECEGCGGSHFESVFKMGKLSKLHAKNTTGQTQLVRWPVDICRDCGHELDFTKLAE